MTTLNRYFLSYQFRKAIGLLLFGGIFLLLLGACKTPPAKSFDLTGIERLVQSGELNKAELLADSIEIQGNLAENDLWKLDSVVELGRRIRFNFSLTEMQVKERLYKYFPVQDTALFSKWETTRKLEVRLTDGEKSYFKNAVANLFRLDDEARKSKILVDGFQVDSIYIFRLQYTARIISETKISEETVLPARMKLTYSIDVDENSVPNGKMIRCWMPFPGEGNARQKNLRLIGSEPENAKIASNKNLQCTVYPGKRAKKDQPTIFRIKFEIEASAQYFDLNPDEIKSYNQESSVFRENMCERAPQIVFTPKIKKLANQILADETNPLKKFRKYIIGSAIQFVGPVPSNTALYMISRDT